MLQQAGKYGVGLLEDPYSFWCDSWIADKKSQNIYSVTGHLCIDNWILLWISPFRSWIALKSLLIKLTDRSLIIELNDTSGVFAGTESEALKVKEANEKTSLDFLLLMFLSTFSRTRVSI